jgi:hypothetical protein
MNTKRAIITYFLATIFFAGCTPSAQAVQTAMAKTQAAMPTPTLTATAIPSPMTIPSPTINPCSDRGWADIINYITQYNLSVKNVQVGSSIFAYVQTLKNYEEKINGVVIDSCTEHARQLVVTGLSNQTSAWQTVLSGGKDYSTELVNGIKMLQDANTELNSLGLHVNLP